MKQRHLEVTAHGGQRDESLGSPSERVCIGTRCPNQSPCAQALDRLSVGEVSVPSGRLDRGPDLLDKGIKVGIGVGPVLLF